MGRATVVWAILAVATAACSDADEGTNSGTTPDAGILADGVADTGAPDGEGDAPGTDEVSADATHPDGADGTGADATGDDAAVDPDADPGAFAYLVVEPPALDFGTWAPGDVQTRDVELENAGDKVLTISSVTLLEGSGAFATNLHQLILGPGQKKLLKVTFYVLDVGTFEDTVRFESNAINGAHVDLPLVGKGVEPACEDADGDGHGIGCAGGGDCNDSDPDVYVGAPEICNGADDDCDGLLDEDFVGLGSACDVGFGACVADGFKICGDDGASLKCSVNPVTGGDELCNELDDDCDGAVDEDFPSKGKLCTVGLGACAVSDKYVCSADGTSLVCNVTPDDPGPEICGDGIDNDCDGIVDEGDIEVCDDNIDNDCDGETDESGSTWGEVFFARNYYGNTVAIYTSNGDGTFQAAKPVDFGDLNNYSVHAVGDFDGDRYLDLIVVRTETAGETLCATAADCPSGTRCAGGVCRQLCSTSTNNCPAGQTCIDWNNNVAADDTFCMPPRSIMMARSSCEGTNIQFTELFQLQPGEVLGPVIDTDGNGHLDFLIREHFSSGVGFVWMNDGAGNFTKLPNSFNFASLLTWQWGLVNTSKDLTGDGVVDMLGYRFTSGGSPPTQLYLFIGNGDGTFQTPFQIAKTLPYPANLITADDFDGDGDQDIVGGLDDDGQPGGAWMLLNRDEPTGNSWVDSYPIFDVCPTYNSGGEHPGVGRGQSFDFDGDDQPDVLAAWTPEECGSYIWGCTQISDPANICYGGNCRKVALYRNNTRQPCGVGTSCIDGQCEPGCTADCTGKQCGSDGCGGTCGTCGGGQICASGKCVVDCVPQCAGKQCGDNGCGGICGACAQGESCVDNQCVAGCVPSCNGKQCGDDGCGGTCAVFQSASTIEFSDNPATNVTAPTNVPPTTPQIAVQGSAEDEELTCAIVAESYDLDPVTYRFRWYRDGDFVAELGEKQVVPPSLTAVGEVWQCRVRATDGVEWSPQTEAEVTVVAGEGTP